MGCGYGLVVMGKYVHSSGRKAWALGMYDDGEGLGRIYGSGECRVLMTVNVW